jgi:hypothetical protein
MLRGHKWPRQQARPMISPLGFRLVRGDVNIHSLGRFHIGGVAHFVWALPPNVGETGGNGNGPMPLSTTALFGPYWVLYNKHTL